VIPSAVLNDCSMELPSVEGLDDTPPPDETGTAAAFVFVGLGATAFVGAGFGVFVGNGVDVGAGVFVGRGVAVGSGVFVGAGVGVLVGSGVAVGGIGVEVGGSVGTTVGVGSGVGVAQPANHAIDTTNIRQRRNKACILLLIEIDSPRRLFQIHEATEKTNLPVSLLLSQCAERLVQQTFSLFQHRGSCCHV
jgi:hypothetical protein